MFLFHIDVSLSLLFSLKSINIFFKLKKKLWRWRTSVPMPFPSPSSPPLPEVHCLCLSPKLQGPFYLCNFLNTFSPTIWKKKERKFPTHLLGSLRMPLPSHSIGQGSHWPGKNKCQLYRWGAARSEREGRGCWGSLWRLAAIPWLGSFFGLCSVYP